VEGLSGSVTRGAVLLKKSDGFFIGKGEKFFFSGFGF
jgi:hypothetical protein